MKRTVSSSSATVLISNVSFNSLFRSPRLLSSSTSYRLNLLSWSSFFMVRSYTTRDFFYELFDFVFPRHFDCYMTRKWFLMRFYQPNSQCSITNLNKRFLPRPKTITSWKLIPHRSKISKNWNPPQWVPLHRFFTALQ